MPVLFPIINRNTILVRFKHRYKESNVLHFKFKQWEVIKVNIFPDYYLYNVEQLGCQSLSNLDKVLSGRQQCRMIYKLQTNSICIIKMLWHCLMIQMEFVSKVIEFYTSFNTAICPRKLYCLVKYNTWAINSFLRLPHPFTIPIPFVLFCHSHFYHSTKGIITRGCVSSCVVSRDCAQRNSCYKADTGGASPQCECSCEFLTSYDTQSSCHTAGREMVVPQNVLLGVPWEWSVA